MWCCRSHPLPPQVGFSHHKCKRSVLPPHRSQKSGGSVRHRYSRSFHRRSLQTASFCLRYCTHRSWWRHPVFFPVLPCLFRHRYKSSPRRYGPDALPDTLRYYSFSLRMYRPDIRSSWYGNCHHRYRPSHCLPHPWQWSVLLRPSVHKPA